MNTIQPGQLVRDCLTAWEDNDRAKLESLLAEDFTFTSPHDDHLSKAEYWKVCWANSATIQTINILSLLAGEDEAFVRYECELSTGKRFCNTEYFRFEDNKIASVDVYFGREIASRKSN